MRKSQSCMKYYLSICHFLFQLPIVIGSVAGAVLLIGVVVAVILACHANYKSERKDQSGKFSNTGYLPDQESPPSYKSAPRVPSAYSHRAPSSHASRGPQPRRSEEPSVTGRARVSYRILEVIVLMKRKLKFDSCVGFQDLHGPSCRVFSCVVF